MMRTKFFLMVLAAIVMGSQVTLFAQEKKETKSERRQFNKEQMLEIQCNQIIKGLALDDATATKFIPVNISPHFEPIFNCSRKHIYRHIFPVFNPQPKPFSLSEIYRVFPAATIYKLHMRRHCLKPGLAF